MSDPSFSRRDLIGTAALAGAAALLPGDLAAQAPAKAPAPSGFRIVTSHNGVEAARATRQALLPSGRPHTSRRRCR